ncbi:MAG: hypothetical protein N2255_00935, partial [Kiritimatiellae bacterium]|nr:hypothetical protein [Kiritimatiellia bacterium]
FDHCGHSAGSVATHSVYISQRCTRLTFRYNYSTHTHDGHLLKSRAKESWVMYNRLTDEDGAGSAVADFPNGGLVVLVGNLMHKGPKGHNNRMIAVGMEGLKHERNEIYVVNNTMWWNNRRPNEAWFVRLENRRPAVGPASGQETDPQPRAKAVILNNICIGPIGIINREEAQLDGNLLFRSPEEAGFVDFDKFDFHLKPTSPCRDRGRNPGEVDGISLKPVFHYLHPASFEKRPEDGALDVGAYECRAR